MEIKNPSQHTKPFPLTVRYISHKCLKKRISGFDGSVITEPSYNIINIPMHQQDDDLWTAKVAMTGGGLCKWTLSVVNLGIEYIDATHLGKDLVLGSAVGVTVAFDSDAARNGQFTLVKGDLTLSPRYYPYIREKKIGIRENSLSLFGKEDFILLRVDEISSVRFFPEINERKLIRFVGLERKSKGEYPKIIYPDGSVASEKTLFPDFDKVDEMKLK